MSVAVVTDTTHYLPREMIDAEGIRLVSLYVNWPGIQEREVDLLDFTDFYERLRVARALPTTSQPSIGDFLAVYEPLLAEGRDVLSIHLSGGISGTVGAARQAAEQAAERGHAGRIEVIDSETACGGLGLLVLAAARAARAGADLRGAVEAARRVREELKIWFAVDTLEYLQRGGRIGKAQAMLGTALKIKPILSIESEILPIERVRTAGRAFDRLVDYMQARRDDGADGWVVQHIQAHEQAERLVEAGRGVFRSEPLWVSEIGPVIGAHVGPGLLGAGGCPRSLVEF
ncbi:MAG TPA: DegV family protein [Solirubrobacteraceae bacterium]|jgi:DegV family protein with EDD domain